MVERLALGAPQPFLHLAHQAKFKPSSPALASAEGGLTYLQLLEHSRRIAQTLRERGVRPGDIVVTQLAEHLNLPFMEALFHEAAIGCTYPGAVEETNPVGFDWLVTHDSDQGFPQDRTILVDETFLRETASLSPSVQPLRYDSFESVCRLIFSSGTTGTPMAIPYTITMAEGRSRHADQHWMTLRPFMTLLRNLGGTGFAVAYSSVASGDTYISPASASENVRLIKDNLVAVIQGSPTQLAELAHAVVASGEDVTDVAVIQSLGSSISSELIHRLREVFGATVATVYGSTEAGIVTMRDDLDGDIADVGPPVPGVELQIVDDDDRPVEEGSSGIVRYRKPFLADAYFRGGPEGRQMSRDGWIYPGDLGRLTGEGHLVLMGRASEIINAGGVKFDPAVIDAFVAGLAGVRDAATFSFDMEHGVSGYAVAVVADADLDVSSLAAPIAKRCGDSEPRYLVRVNEIKRNITGKVRRADMADDLRALLAQRQR